MVALPYAAAAIEAAAERRLRLEPAP